MHRHYCSDNDATSTTETPNAFKQRRWDDNKGDVKQKAATRKKLGELTLTNAEAAGVRQFQGTPHQRKEHRVDYARYEGGSKG